MACEIGTFCQIAVFGNGAFFAPKGSFSAISHYVFNECRPSTVSSSTAIFVVRNRRTWPFLGPKNAPFCCKNVKLRMRIGHFFGMNLCSEML